MVGLVRGWMVGYGVGGGVKGSGLDVVTSRAVWLRGTVLNSEYGSKLGKCPRCSFVVAKRDKLAVVNDGNSE